MPRLSFLRAAVATVAVLAELFAGPDARAAVAEVDAFSLVQTNFDGNILTNDLINSGSAALSGTSTSGSVSSYQGDVGAYNGNRPNSFLNLADGAASSKQTSGPNANLNDISHDAYFDGASFNTGPSITYTFNAAANPNGFTLNSINSINGWADTTSFSNQRYRVSVAPVNAPGRFTDLASVNYAPFSGNAGTPNSSQVTLSGSGGAALASNVGAVRFSFLNNAGSGQVVREIDVTGQASTTAPPPPPPALPVILPLGDSITYGDQASGGPVPGGYRTKLYTNLTNAGVAFNYAGSQTGNASATLANAGQVNNEGHNGYRIDQITGNLDASDGTGGNNGGYWLAGGNGTGRDPVNPDFILLHIGTNDILQGRDLTTTENNLLALVNQLIADRPNANLLLSNIIPINGSQNATVKDYNAYIKDMLVPQKQLAGKHVFFVDQYRNFVDANGNIIAARLPDNIHPDQTGYDLMGDTWFAAIQSVPEPSTAVLFAGAAAGAALRRGRRQVRGTGDAIL